VTQPNPCAKTRRRPWLRRGCLLSGLLAALALPIAGHAQVDSREGIALQNQIYQLRQELHFLRGEAGRGYPGGGGNDAAADLLSRVQAMEEQVRQLRGRIDETMNLVTRQNADLAKRIDDLTFQLNLQQGKSGSSVMPGSSAPAPGPIPPPVREVAPRPAPDTPRPQVQQGLNLTPGPLPTVVPPPRSQSFTFNQVPEPMREAPPRADPARPVPRPPETASKPPPDPQPPPAQVAAAQIPPGGKRTPEMALQDGHAALARRDYPAAERAAREVMANRASPRAYDGQLLLAQALAGEKQFAQAAIAFDDTYNRSHKGRHAEDALLGLAGALTAINERKAACDTLGRLRAEFPEVRADLKDAITKTNERAGCSR
jgi:TolA-binding protein